MIYAHYLYWKYSKNINENRKKGKEKQTIGINRRIEREGKGARYVCFFS